MKVFALTLLATVLPIVLVGAIWHAVATSWDDTADGAVSNRSSTSSLAPAAPVPYEINPSGQSALPESDSSDAESPLSYLERGEPQKALRAFDRLLLESPDDPNLLVGKALSLTALGRAVDALALYERAIEHSPEDPVINYNYGVALVRSGELDRAIEVFTELTEENSDDVALHHNLAGAYQANGQWKAALDIWRQLTDELLIRSAATQPSHDRVAAAWFHRGECAMTLQLDEEALAAFRRVAEYKPKDTGALCNRGILLARNGRRDEATAVLQNCLEIDPGFVPALNQLAYIRAADFQATGAERYRTEALSWSRRSLDRVVNQPNIQALRRALENGSVADLAGPDSLHRAAPPISMEGVLQDHADNDG
jgi:tetratricopeptide (TPR) repeat protein